MEVLNVIQNQNKNKKNNNNTENNNDNHNNDDKRKKKKDNNNNKKKDQKKQDKINNNDSKKQRKRQLSDANNELKNITTTEFLDPVIQYYIQESEVLIQAENERDHNKYVLVRNIQILLESIGKGEAMVTVIKFPYCYLLFLYLISKKKFDEGKLLFLFNNIFFIIYSTLLLLYFVH